MATRAAPARSAALFLPTRVTLPALRSAARDCHGCDLYARATQTVFGEGTSRAWLMVVGEQPGDKEDREGHPFVGPAGGVLAQALERAGLERRDVYVTNAVKHFKWFPRGKRRMHDKPSYGEVGACRPWLTAELGAVDPVVVLCLGSTAAQSFFGAAFRLTPALGRTLHAEGRPVIVTYHPAAILRMPTHEAREAGRAALVRALELAKGHRHL